MQTCLANPIASVDHDPAQGLRRRLFIAILLGCPILLIISLWRASGGWQIAMPPLVGSLLAYIRLWLEQRPGRLGLGLTTFGHLVLGVAVVSPTDGHSPAAAAVGQAFGNLAPTTFGLGLVILGCANCLAGFLSLAGPHRAARAAAPGDDMERMLGEISTLESILDSTFALSPSPMVLVAKDGTVRLASSCARALFVGLQRGEALTDIVRCPTRNNWLNLNNNRLESLILRDRDGRTWNAHLSGMREGLVLVVLSPHEKEEDEQLGQLSGFFSQVSETLGSLAQDAEELRNYSRHASTMETCIGRILKRSRRHFYQLANFATHALDRALPPGVAPVNPTLRRALEPDAYPYSLDRIEVTTALENTTPMVALPTHYLELVCWNVLENAFRASLAHGPIGNVWINAVSDSNWVKITITDQAGGIDPYELPHLYEPLHAPTPGHLHLGLAVSRKIMEAYGGHLAVGSDRGGGTRVSLHLPRA